MLGATHEIGGSSGCIQIVHAAGRQARCHYPVGCRERLWTAFSSLSSASRIATVHFGAVPVLVRPSSRRTSRAAVKAFRDHLAPPFVKAKCAAQGIDCSKLVDDGTATGV